ncbi:uncharacterized protein [Fopius arisanus]|uniref:Uncharacterized protein n=1 Tax=Fopius arisanus TaxID=64838 RepID=A0A9R1TI05_9HYME|nr:PREDICTED: uncharacterized protein LOC105270415 [Fopius arisanus]XP_011309633.1 PREDICTED: uncharacterized protein LOC105270415 [Fopius arisanus]
MAGSGDSADSKALGKFGLRPVTKCSLVKFYAPCFGVGAYMGLSVNVMNPTLVMRVFPKVDITNFLLGGALLGTGSYLYTREHMRAAPTGARITYSITGALLLSFGSVLVWAVLRSIMLPNPTVSTLAGLGTGLAAIKIGHNYLEFVDSQVAKK